MYKEEEGRGVRSSKIHTQKLSLAPTAMLDNILHVGREAFFSDYDLPNSSLHLADSSGNILECAESEGWTLGKYFEENHYQPNRHKLYIM